MNSQKSIFVLFALIAFAWAEDMPSVEDSTGASASASASLEDGGRSGGSGGSGESGEHGPCIIAPALTTNCSGVTGANCTDAANLKALVAAGTTSVLVCVGSRTTPRTATVSVKLDIEPCRGCTCFTVAAAELRTCALLNADPAFVKNACNNQASLAALLAAGDTAKVCVFRRNGTVKTEASVPIAAALEAGHH